MPINRKNMLPRLSDGKAVPLRRSHFLEGTLKTYFGPGQGPQNIFGAYKKPTDWNKAGTLLRVPRVVWLQMWFASAIEGLPATFSQTWSNAYYDQRFSSTIMTFDNSTFPPTPVYFGDGPYTSVTRNTDYEEHARLLDVFGQVKERIEELQPGRTWVQVSDWNANSASFANGWMSDGFLQFAAPSDFETDPYFGTDFLNIWAGHAAYNHFGSTFFFGHYTPLDPIEADNFYGAPKSRLIDAYDKFRRHRTLVYHTDQAWPAPDVTPDPESAHGFVLYDPHEITHPIGQAGAKDFMNLLAEDMAEYEFSHPGGTSLLTVDYLVNLIAEHYHFDPDTGADLP
jgi:hypothetical protein